MRDRLRRPEKIDDAAAEGWALRWQLLLLLIPLVFAPKVSSAAVVELKTQPLAFGSPESVFVRCGGASTRGCTEFSDVTLLSACSQETFAEWRIRSQISASVRMSLSDSHYLRHEMLHVTDIRAALTEFATALESDRFQARDDCERAGRAAHDGFTGAVKEMIRHSMERRDMDPKVLPARRATGE